MSVQDLFDGNIMWLPKRGFVFGDNKDEIITKAAQSVYPHLSLEDWEPVAVIGCGAYDKGKPWNLAAKKGGKWFYYNEWNSVFTIRVRAKVKFHRVMRETVADEYMDTLF